MHELLAGVVARIDLGDRAQLRVGAEHQVGAATGPALAVGAGAGERFASGDAPAPAGSQVEQVDEEVIRQRARVAR